MNVEISRKQRQFFELMEDPEITELFIGGSAGGGKSFSIGLIVTLWAIKYPGVRFFIGRKTLKSLKQSTIATLLGKVFPALGVKAGDYHMGWQSMELSFKNGSIIIFGELENKPSDPVFSRVGSLEIDAAIIDEAGEVSKMAKDAIKSRTGRGVMAKYGMPGKLLLASNPDLGWLKDEYYDPYKKLGASGLEKWEIGKIELNGKKLPTYRAFLRIGAYDNPFLPQSYIDNLKTLPSILRKRLLDGDWNYADDENSLFRAGLLDKAMTYDNPTSGEKFNKFIGVDVSDKGGDKTIFSLIVNGVLITQKASRVQMNWDSESELPMSRLLADELVEFAMQNGFTPRFAKHIAVECNGVGVGLRDMLKERGWMLTEYIATHKSRSEGYYQMMLDMDSGALKMKNDLIGLDELRRQLSSHTYVMTEQTPSVVKKEKIKQTIGHSPDEADSLMIANWVRNWISNPQNDPKRNKNRLLY